jgi:hypothetical protein
MMTRQPLWTNELSDTAHQEAIAPGTKITMQNWQQYKAYMFPGIIAGQVFLEDAR